MINDLIQRIDKNTSLFIENFEGLMNKELNWKPDQATWSIGQNIQHLNLLNESYFEIFSNLKSGTIKIPFTGKIGFINSFFMKLISQATDPSREKKTKTMNLWNTSSMDVPDEVFTRFTSNQEVFKRYITELEQHIRNKDIIHSPLSKSLTFPVDEFIEEMVNHELRHFNQAKEVLGKLNAENNRAA